VTGDVEMRGVPEGYREIKLGMTNFDHTIDACFEERLRNEQVWGRHWALDFNGRVWFEDGVFHEQVWRYYEPRAHFAEPTLAELMTTVNDAYGWE
jgi:hypothetical protein